MKTSKIIFQTLLIAAVVVLAYFCIDSVVTPIKFEETRALREEAIKKNLINIRTAQVEFKLDKGYFTTDFDSLILFLQTAPKKEVLKEGRLTDKQLENGLTEAKAAKILERAKIKARAKAKQPFASEDELYAYVWENDREVKANGLEGLRRDTIYKNMIETLYKGEFNNDNINTITYIPFTDNKRFELEVNNGYKTSQGIPVPLFEVRAPFEAYLADLDKQELANLIDKEQKMEHYTGLKVGDINAPNNNAGNWE